MSDGKEIDVALIGHPSNFDHFVQLVAKADGEAAARRATENEAMFTAMMDWMPAYATSHHPTFHLKNSEIRAALIICPFLPQRIGTPHQLKSAFGKVKQAVGLAAKMGARVATLGGFTSILAGTRRAKLARQAGITLTAGNGLTAALAVDQLVTAVEQRGRSQDNETIAVVGATGDVGQVMTRLLAGRPLELLLAAQDQTRLEALRGTLQSPRVSVVPVAEALSQAGGILVATSASAPIFSTADVRPDAIVCDAGFPCTVSESTDASAILMRAGLATLPHSSGLESYTQLANPTQLFGCFTEGIILGADKVLQAQADERALTSPQDALALLDAARRLGIFSQTSTEQCAPISRAVG